MLTGASSLEGRRAQAIALKSGSDGGRNPGLVRIPCCPLLTKLTRLPWAKGDVYSGPSPVSQAGQRRMRGDKLIAKAGVFIHGPLDFLAQQ